MSQTSKDKAPQAADRESRIVAFLERLPENLEPGELEAVILAIAGAYMPEKVLPLFFLYLGATAKQVDMSEDITTH
jgi:hypothetical protein